MGKIKYAPFNPKVYRAWRGMKIRCFWKEGKTFGRYGGRGITVCIGLLSFTTFRQILGEPPTKDHSVDRENNNANYSCGQCDECVSKKWVLNVRWATKKQQSENRRICYEVDIEGKSVTLKEACRIKGLPYRQIHERVKRGKWDIQIAVNTPLGKPHSYKKIKQ